MFLIDYFVNYGYELIQGTHFSQRIDFNTIKRSLRHSEHRNESVSVFKSQIKVFILD